MNRTERLYAVAEELRRAGASGTTSERLSRSLEVSVRTIKRDVSALQQAGLPVRAEAGPGGGYVLDAVASLPPVNYTPAQAVAVSVALALLPPGSPFAVDAATARAKLWDALGPGDRERASRLASRVWTRGGAPPDDAGTTAAKASPLDGGSVATGVLRAVEQALAGERVLAIRYRSHDGRASRRRVEPVLLAHTGGHWYLVAWCRDRDGMRWFRLDRVERADVTAEPYVPRPVEEVGEPPEDAAAVTPSP
ncbi:helix-turn-helix transcriptional regulator [Luteimicrobium sp. NPDC057192]|uniref:helix-turn-helix transcriptional regulator n=1 Tax=Luteimicrobium sp. NPDC057192 TaxID=3346042 RepID=UPI0036364347